MSASHDHSDRQTLPESRLIWALLLTGGYLVAQVVGGIVFGSLALLSDAAHMFTDVMGLVIALVAIRLGKRQADTRRTFGYRRFEILAAALNAAILFVVAFYILLEAYNRLNQPSEVQSLPMLLVALGGLVVNVIAARLLMGGSGESLNVRGAYLEVLSDLLGSVAVIVGALLIFFTGWDWVDPVLAALIGLWVLPRTWVLLSQSVNILLEGIPEGIDLIRLQGELAALPGVSAVHDLHVWAVTSGENSLSVHLVMEQPEFGLIPQVRTVAEGYGIEHVTVQLETPAMREAEAHGHDTWR